MRNDERRKQIVEIVMEEESIRVSDLIDRVDGSAATVRRDLTFLEQNGYILRKHGFVKYVQPEMVQSIEFSPEMLEIAKAAAKLVEDGDTIMLDSGFSTLALAYQLTSVNNLTVITNSIPVAALYNSRARSGFLFIPVPHNLLKEILSLWGFLQPVRIHT